MPNLGRTLLMVFSTMSELCSEFDSSREHGSSRTSARCIECAVVAERVGGVETRPLTRPPRIYLEKLMTQKVPCREASIRTSTFIVCLGGNRDLHFNCRNLHNTPPELLNRLCLLAPCCVLGGGLYRWWRTPDSAGILEIASPRSRDRRSSRNAEDSHSRLSRAARRIRPLVRTHTRTSRRRLDVSELRARRPL